MKNQTKSTFLGEASPDAIKLFKGIFKALPKSGQMTMISKLERDIMQYDVASDEFKSIRDIIGWCVLEIN